MINACRRNCAKPIHGAGHGVMARENHNKVIAPCHIPYMGPSRFPVGQYPGRARSTTISSGTLSSPLREVAKRSADDVPGVA
jgi:hypothetical protein